MNTCGQKPFKNITYSFLIVPLRQAKVTILQIEQNLPSFQNQVKILLALKAVDQYKLCTIENNANLNSMFYLIKSSKNDFIFLPEYYLIMWPMTSAIFFFEKIATLKK